VKRFTQRAQRKNGEKPEKEKNVYRRGGEGAEKEREIHRSAPFATDLRASRMTTLVALQNLLLGG
jgi:hypothetical protein